MLACYEVQVCCMHHLGSDMRGSHFLQLSGGIVSLNLVACAGVCPPDAITFDYVQQRTDAPFEAVHADDNASYVEEYRFDVSKLEPLVAAPHSPDNRKKASECSSVAIDRVYIG